MKVYRSTPRAIEPSHVDEFYWRSTPVSIQIREDDTPRDTGLLDANGNKIMSHNYVAPIGFNRS